MVVFHVATTSGAAETSHTAEGQTPQEILEALDAFSPSNPDPKDLVALFQMRTGKLPARFNVLKVTVAGFAAAVKFVSAMFPATTVPAQFAPSLKKSVVGSADGATDIEPVEVLSPCTTVA